MRVVEQDLKAEEEERQGIAISMLLEGADPDVPFGPEGGA